MSRNMKILAAGVVTTLVVAVIISIVAVNATNYNNDDDSNGFKPVSAICVINAGPKGTLVKGTLRLTQTSQDGPVRVQGSVSGLPPNTKHGFHVHMYGDFSNADNPCVSCGAHFNPNNKTHGGPKDPIRHAGDLGNIDAEDDGVATIDKSDKELSFDPSSRYYILGRAFVVHDKVDDLGKDGLDSLNTGNAGARLGCCIIGLAGPPPA